MKEVRISVQERPSAHGYMVQICYVEDGMVVNPRKYPVDTFEEAEILAGSMKRFVDSGCEVSVLLAQGLDE